MKVSLQPVKPTVQKFTELRNKITYSALLGRYKDFKAASKEYASLAVKDFDTARTTPASKVNVPLFSKMGFNMVKIWFLNKFRIKSPDEKLLKKMAQEFKANQIIKNSQRPV